MRRTVAIELTYTQAASINEAIKRGMLDTDDMTPAQRRDVWAAVGRWQGAIGDAFGMSDRQRMKAAKMPIRRMATQEKEPVE